MRSPIRLDLPDVIWTVRVTHTRACLNRFTAGFAQHYCRQAPAHTRHSRRRGERVAAGDYTRRLPVVQDDDLGSLVECFNRMQAGLAERQRLQAAFGTYVDPVLAARLIEQGDDIFTGERRTVTVIFAPPAQPRSTLSSRECQGSTETTVNNQPKHCQASPETKTSSISRAHTPLSGAGGARTRDQRIMSPRL
jgi:hypothetical protein